MGSTAIIEVSIIGDNTRNPALRHSGEGRNPAYHMAPRSGQGRIVGVVPLLELLVKLLAIRLTKQETLGKSLVIAIRLGCQKTPAKSLVMHGVLSIVWIPAFAGMTAVENVCVMNYGKINNWFMHQSKLTLKFRPNARFIA